MTRLDPQHRQHDALPPTSVTRKKRKWPWIVFGVLGSLIGLGAIANAVDPTPQPADSREPGTTGRRADSGSPFTNSRAHCCSVRTRTIRTV